MNRRGLPPGYRNVQEFLLYYHKNNPPNVEAAPVPENLKNEKIPDSAKSFKKELCMQKIPAGHTPIPQTDGRRQYYEREQKCDVLPSSLMNPGNIVFRPITSM